MPLSTRDDYQHALAIVRAFLCEWAPYLLIENGAPDDEFDGEAHKIVAGLRVVRVPQDLEHLISETFIRSLGSEGFSAEHCRSVANQMFRSLVDGGVLGPGNGR